MNRVVSGQGPWYLRPGWGGYDSSGNGHIERSHAGGFLEGGPSRPSGAVSCRLHVVKK